MPRHLILPLLLLVSTFCSAAPAPERVSITTRDGIILRGTYTAPAPRKPVVVLLHGLGSNKEEWAPLERLLAARGYGFCAYDARGHGESVTTTRGTPVDYRTFGLQGADSPWHAMIGDLGDVLRFLRRTHRAGSARALIGASLGANIALNYAADDPSISATVLLSPGIEYAGIGTITVIDRFNDRRLAIAASMNDNYAFQSARALFDRVKDNPRALFMTGPGGHGVQMFNGTFEGDVMTWLAR